MKRLADYEASDLEGVIVVRRQLIAQYGIASPSEIVTLLEQRQREAREQGANGKVAWLQSGGFKSARRRHAEQFGREVVQHLFPSQTT